MLLPKEEEEIQFLSHSSQCSSAQYPQVTETTTYIEHSRPYRNFSQIVLLTWVLGLMVEIDRKPEEEFGQGFTGICATTRGSKNKW